MDKIPRYLMAIHNRQEKVYYGKVDAQIVKVGGVVTALVFREKQRVRFNSRNNGDAWAKMADVVKGLPEKGHHEVDFRVVCHDGAVKEIEIEARRRLYFPKNPEQ